jgi:hypothetical protein
MPTESFEQLLEVMPKIAKVVNQFSSETVQGRVCEALMAALLGNDALSRQPSSEISKVSTKKAVSVGKTGAATKKSPPTGIRSARSDKYSVVPDLNLHPKKGKSLQAFVSEKGPKTNEEHFAVMVYYMEKTLEISVVGPNHIYTCFKDIKVRVPSNLRVVLGNAARRKGWFSSTVDDLKITTHGENFVDHELPHKEG